MDYVKKFVGYYDKNLVDAILSENISEIKSFISKGCDVNIIYNNLTPIMYSCVVGNEEIFNILMDSGAKTSKCNSENITPLMISSSHNNSLAITKRLINMNKKSVNYKDQKGNNALIYSTMAKEDTTESMKLLIENGAHINSTNRLGLSSLSYSAMMGDIDKLNLLIDSGADVNDGALIYACIWNRKEIAEYLISNGADVNIYADDESVLAGACRMKNVEIVEMLLEKGVDMNDDYALRYALNNIEILELLIGKNIQFNYFFDGPLKITTLQLIKDSNNKKIYQLLSDYKDSEDKTLSELVGGKKIKFYRPKNINLIPSNDDEVVETILI